MGLTNRQKRFVEFYLQSWNASDAARRAGYKGESNRIGSRLLTYVDVQAYIKQRMQETAMKSDEALTRLADIARFSLPELIVERQRPVYDRDGNQVGTEQVFELDWEKVRQNGHMIKSLANTPAGVKIEAYDGQHALELIGKGLGIIKENVEQKNTNEEVKITFYMPENGRDPGN